MSLQTFVIVRRALLLSRDGLAFLRYNAFAV